MATISKPITKDLIVQHGLSDDEYKKFVEILRCERPNETGVLVASIPIQGDHNGTKGN
jgi:hypothetical protein